MNTISKHDQKLSETLKSLSIEPIPYAVQPPGHPLRRLMLPLCLLTAMSGTAAGIMLYLPDVAGRIQTIIPHLSQRAATVAGTESGDANLPRGGGNAEGPALPRPLPVAREITGSGFVVAPRMTTVFSKYEGRITEIAVEAGDAVVAGQVLVRLDDAAARFALEQANAAKTTATLQLASRAIALTQARASLVRIETLAAREATSKQALEEAQAAADQASNAVAQARQSVASADLSIRIAEERLDELTVRAPFAGMVTRLDAHVGDMVLARLDSISESRSLLTVTDMTSLTIDADVAETSIAALRMGLRGEAVLDGFPDQPFAVSILKVAPVASADKGTIMLRLSLDHPPEGIRPNMAARIRIPLNDTGDMTQ